MEHDGQPVDFVQENLSRSLKRGTVRGLHYQRPPHAQHKLVQVISGAVYDVVVDIRPWSPAFGRHVGVELSDDNGLHLFVPAGFAHGFQTLTDDARVLYKVSAYFDAASDAAIRWDDPELGIDWPAPGEAATLSAKDAAAPLLNQVDTGF